MTDGVDRSQWPATADAYTLHEQIGTGGSATVWRGFCTPMNSEVAIKKINLEETKVLLDVIRKEIMTLGLSSHPNVVQFYTSFLVEENLWLVMDFMAAGSVLDIMKFKFQGGLEEPLIATIMREALKGIKYFHDTERIHRDVKAGNILISGTGDVKLADLGVAAWLMADGERKDLTKTFVGTPCWMAPEVMEQTTGHSFTADIWSFGITALELAHGQVPFAHLKPMKVLLTVLKEPPPTLEADEMKSRGWSKSFKEMIDSCLQKDPTKRPSSAKLLDHRFFKGAKKPDYVVNNMLTGLPLLGDRFKHALQRQKESIRGSSPSEIPDDDLADDADDLEPWDFGDHELDTPSTKESTKKKKKVRSDTTGDEETNDEVKPRKSKKKEKKVVTSDDDDEDGDDNNNNSGDDDEAPTKSRRKKKGESTRKGSKAPEPDEEVISKKSKDDKGDGEPVVKKGRFTVVSADSLESENKIERVGSKGPAASLKASGDAKLRNKSKSVDIRQDECPNCQLLRAQLVALKKENKELKKMVEAMAEKEN